MFALGAVSANDNVTDEMLQTPESQEIEQYVSGNSFNDIQNAIYSSNDGDVIELHGDYTSSNSPITVSKSIIIEGNGATLNANRKSSIFNINSKSLTLKNINLINSNDVAITSNGCNLIIINCTFSQNGGELSYNDYEESYDVTCDYGTIYAKNGKLTLVNSLFFDNLANVGYAICALDCEFNAINSTFSHHNTQNYNMGTNGRIVYLVGYCKASLANCIFNDNGVNALHISCNTNVTDCIFENNHDAIDIGTSVMSPENSIVNVFNSTFRNNKGNSIRTVLKGTLNICNCSFINNFCTAIESHYTMTNINNSEFLQNQGENGGALRIYGVTNINHSNFIGNTAVKGGTIYATGSVSDYQEYENVINIFDSLITDSSSSNEGGAIYASFYDINLFNSTITNLPASSGSQIYLEASGFKSSNSNYGLIEKIDKINLYLDARPLKTTFDSGKRFYVGLSRPIDGYLWSVQGVKVMFKVYTGNKFKIYYFNPQSSSVDPYFKIDGSLSVGKHKVEIISNSEHFTFDKEITTITIKKAKTIVKAPKVISKYKKSKYFKVTIKNKASGKVVINIKVKIKVFTGKKYRSYIVKTDKKGVAKINTKKLKRGIHTVKISSKNKNYEISKKSTIKIK